MYICVEVLVFKIILVNKINKNKDYYKLLILKGLIDQPTALTA